MKMTKKKTTLLALFAVSVIALAGIGYAAVNEYIAVTVNDNNAAHSAYITARQTEYSEQFNGTVDLYTYSDANFEYIYALPGSTQVHTINQVAYYGVAIGSGTTITVADNTDLDTAQYTIAADITSANALPAGWTYILVYGGTVKAVVENGSAAATVVVPNNNAITVQLYIAGPAFSTMKTTGQNPVGPLVTPSVPNSWANYGASTTYTGANDGEIYASANFVFTVTAAEAPAQQP